MKAFLTSSRMSEDGLGLNPENGFLNRLAEAAKDCRHGVFIASDPFDYDAMETYGSEVIASLESAGLTFDSFDLLDNRNCGKAAKLLKKADFIFLAGGHVPTENAFIHRFPLKMLLKNFKGVFLSESAGSMNCCEEVYAQPELEGESVDPNYKRYLKGLGLTKVKILPHYNLLQEEMLDGKLLYEDITFSDSMGKTFFVFVDGTYLLKDEEGERIYGECWTIHDGKMTKISENGDEVWVEKE